MFVDLKYKSSKTEICNLESFVGMKEVAEKFLKVVPSKNNV